LAFALLVFGSCALSASEALTIAGKTAPAARIVVATASTDSMMQKTGAWCQDFLTKRGYIVDPALQSQLSMRSPDWVLETKDACPIATSLGVDCSFLNTARSDAYILKALSSSGKPIVLIVGTSWKGVRSGVARLIALSKIEPSALTVPLTDESRTPFIVTRRLHVCVTGRIAQSTPYADTLWTNWSDERIRQYAEQLWLLGFNSVEIPEIRGYRFDGAGGFSDEELRTKITPKLRVFMQAVRDNGMEVSQFIWGQSLFKEGENYCWNSPTERATMETEYRRLAQTYGDLVDHIVVHVGDPGGCTRNGCDPYITTQQIATFLLQEYRTVNPNATATLSTWANAGFWNGAAGVQFLDTTYSPQEIGIALHRWYDADHAARVVNANRKCDIWCWYMGDYEMELDMGLFMQRLDKYFSALPDQASTDIRAISTELCFQGWPSIMNAYVGAQKMWSPQRSLADIEREFCSATFGEANADAMFALYKVCEQYVHPDRYYGFIPASDCLPEVIGTPAYNKALREAIAAGKAIVIPANSAYRFTSATDPAVMKSYLLRDAELIWIFSEAIETIATAKKAGATQAEIQRVIDEAMGKAATYTADLDYPSLVAKLQAAAATGASGSLVNPGFELNASSVVYPNPPSGWALEPSGCFSKESYWNSAYGYPSYFHSGSEAASLITDSPPAQCKIYQDVSVAPGAAYTVSVWARPAWLAGVATKWGVDPAQQAGLMVQELDGQGSVSVNHPIVPVSSLQAWQQLSSGEFTVGQNTAAIRVGGWANLLDNYGVNLGRVVFDDFTLSGPPPETLPICISKDMPDGGALYIRNVVVTAVFDGCFYVENHDRSAGIKVIGTAALGSVMAIRGILQTVDGERQIVPLSAVEIASVVLRPVDINSGGIAVTIDAANGRTASIRNGQTGEKHDLNTDDCRIELADGAVSLSSVNMELTAQSDSILRFVGTKSGLEIVRTYVLPAGRSYLDRKLTVKNTTANPILLKKVTDGIFSFQAPFQSVSFHKDNMNTMDPGTEYLTETEKPSLYQTSINVFMRSSGGGLYTGLKYPYFKPDIGPDHTALSYETNYSLKPGETLELPTLFYGVYKKTGFICRKELNWTPRILTTEQEEMDWGEVRAMQQVMRDYLPEQPSPLNGYFMWLNSWWANANLRGKMGSAEADAFIALADNVKQAKCLDMMLIAPVWCGWTGFIEPCPEIDAVGDDAVYPRNSSIDRFMAHAKSIGLPIYGFCEPNSLNRHYRSDRPDWKLQPTTDPSKTLIQNCHANEAYEDWFYRLTCSAIDTYDLSAWAWDHCWVRRPMLCYGANHGHEPGNCEFQQYRTVTGLIAKLRQRYPNLFMEVYWGLKEAGPWSLKGLNSLENAYENGSPPPPGMSFADDMRFQHWFNHNYRFIPTYMNLAQVNFQKEANGHLYSIMSCLGSGTSASLTDWKAFSTQAEADTIFATLRTWKLWATSNLAYLKDRIDLFGMPCRKDGIDGTAHIVGDRGFVFVFNPSAGVCYGSIPLTEMIGLTSGSRFSIDEISTGTRKRLGVYATNDDVVFQIQPKSALLYELRPSAENLAPASVPVGVTVQPAFVSGS